jgi:hypothetical protein
MDYKNIKPENLFKELKGHVGNLKNRFPNISNANLANGIGRQLRTQAHYLKLVSYLQRLPQINTTRSNKPILWTGTINSKLFLNSPTLSAYERALIHKKIKEIINNKKLEIQNGRIVYPYPLHLFPKSFNVDLFREILKNYPNLKKSFENKFSEFIVPRPRRLPPLFVTLGKNKTYNNVSYRDPKHGERYFRVKSGGKKFYYDPETMSLLGKTQMVNANNKRILQERIENYKMKKIPLFLRQPSTRQLVNLKRNVLEGIIFNKSKLKQATEILRRMNTRRKSFSN